MNENIKKKGRPKKQCISADSIPDEYLNLCREGKTLSEIAAHFKVSLEEFKKWPDEARKAKLKTVWKLGQTYFQAFHEALYKEMVNNKKAYDASQRTGQKEFLNVYIKEWNVKKEANITVNNKWDNMSEKDLNRELEATLKRKHNKELIYNIFNLNNDKSDSTSSH